MKKKVLVAMSGGMDSAFCALSLLRQGFLVKGITMIAESEKPAEEAAILCQKLQIEHEVVNCKKAFQSHVVQPFLQEYENGRTPNPCVQCNRFIKFDLLYAFREKLNCDFFATGHYVQMQQDKAGQYYLAKAKDEKKDQSYFLYPIRPEIFPYLLFPLGEYLKKEVKESMIKEGFISASKGESQDICFIPNGDYRAFYRQNGFSFAPGNFVDPAGHVLGQHKGLPFYTVGQRKGLGLALGYPAYVVDLLPQTNQVVIGKEEDLAVTTCLVKDIYWHIPWTGEAPLAVQVKYRYKSPPADAVLQKRADGVLVLFQEKQKAVAKGQSAVFYDGNRLLGGGMIQ